MTPPDAAEVGKRAAAEAATALIESGMVIGLGTGSTVAFVLDLLARRIHKEGLTVAGVPTSLYTEERARALGIPLTDLDPVRALDLAIDGADEIETRTFSIIKGLGGALLREKIVAFSAQRFVVVADESKLVPQLGVRVPVPVEIVRFAHAATARRIEQLGGRAVLRLKAGGEPLVTDNGNFIYDVYALGPIADPARLERDIAAIPGVVESGLFTLGVASVFVGYASGTARMLRAPA